MNKRGEKKAWEDFLGNFNDFLEHFAYHAFKKSNETPNAKEKCRKGTFDSPYIMLLLYLDHKIRFTKFRFC